MPQNLLNFAIKIKISKMKFLKLILILLVSITTTAQTNIATDYDNALKLYNAKQYLEAYTAFKTLKSQLIEKDALYTDVVKYLTASTTELEQSARLKGDYQTSLKYSLEAVDLLKGNTSNFDGNASNKELLMNQNIIVAYTGLEKYADANSYKQVLYNRNRENTLPMALSGYFNSEYFKVGDKNVWVYEWYDDAFSERVSNNFSKVVYFVYSTDADGQNKESLYRLHLLPNKDKGNYSLEKQFDRNTKQFGSKFNQVTFAKELDYKALKKEVITIIAQGLTPSNEREIHN